MYDASPPILSYTIWFSQRAGSTLLCDALESTGLARGTEISASPMAGAELP